MTRLDIQTLQVHLDGTCILDDLSLELEAGQVVALVGPNGAGKSTLLRAMAGLLVPSRGTVDLGAQLVSTMSPAERARHISYLAPDGRSAWPMQVRQIVALGRIPHLKPLRRFTTEDEAAIDQAMERAGVRNFAARSFDTLSSGEKARVLFARALANAAPVLLLDEPTAALDLRYQLEIMELAKAEAERGALVILSLHSLELAARYADRVLVLQSGKLVADAAPADALNETVCRDVFGIQAPGGIRPLTVQLADPA